MLKQFVWQIKKFFIILHHSNKEKFMNNNINWFRLFIQGYRMAQSYWVTAIDYTNNKGQVVTTLNEYCDVEYSSTMHMYISVNLN